VRTHSTRLPDSTLKRIETVSMDVSRAYTGAPTSPRPHATICYDPFHITQWVNRVYPGLESRPMGATHS
jgi:transposase